MKCPRCGSTKLRRVDDSDSKFLLVLRPVVIPIQCYWCGHQFHRPTVMAEDLKSTPTYRKTRRAA